MGKIKALYTVSGSIFLSCLLSPVTQAQEDKGATNDAVLEEIVVTARKKMESLQATPVAISAYSSAQLKESNINNLKDLEATTPGLNFSSQINKAPSIFIRGVGQRESVASLDPGVGVYVNGVYIPRTDSQILDTLDFSSIQVLRGPQGTLFGKNSTGGAVIVETEKPNPEALTGSVSGKLGNFDRRDASATLNLPITDHFAVRASAHSISSGGYMENVVDGGDYGEDDRLAANLQTLWELNDDFSLATFLYWSKQAEKGSPVTCFPVDNPAAQLTPFLIPGLGAARFPQACAESEVLAKQDKFASNTSLFEIESKLFSVNATWDITDSTQFKAITSISKQDDITITQDVDGTALPSVLTGTLAVQKAFRLHNSDPANATKFNHKPEKRRQFTQEFQLNSSAFDDRLDYTLGVFFSKENIENSVFANLAGTNGYTLLAATPGNPVVQPTPNLLIPNLIASVGNLTNDSMAIFAQSDFKATDELTITTGLRYTKEKRKRTAAYYAPDNATIAARNPASIIENSGLLIVFNPAKFNDLLAGNTGVMPIIQDGSDSKSQTWSKVTPLLTAAYQLPESMLSDHLNDAMFYATWSKGFKAGGFEPKGNTLQSFEPEEVTNVEFGWKLDMQNDTLRLNGALYHMDYKNLQTRVATNGVNAASILNFIDNAGEASIQGIELELTKLLTDNLTLSSTLSYTDAKYQEYKVSEVLPELDANGFIQQVEREIDRSNEEFPNSPPLNYSIALSYDLNTDLGTFIPRISMTYRDEMFIGVDANASTHKKSTLDDVTLFNAYVRYIPASYDQFELMVFVDNLTDEQYYSGGFASTSSIPGVIAVKSPPRTIGAELSYNF